MKPLVPILMLFAAVPAAAQVPLATPVPVIAGTRLDLVAEGEVTRVPDLATIGAGVVTQAGSAAAAMSANAAKMAATLAALRKAGVADRDIQTSAVQLNPQYRYGNNVPPTITGYQASNQVSIRFREIKRAGTILDALVAAGANQINGPTLSVEGQDAALDAARSGAVAKARARAELYAKAAGLRVKRILAISEAGGGFTPPMPMALVEMARAEKADTAIEPGEQRLTVSVTVSFELE